MKNVVAFILMLTVLPAMKIYSATVDSIVGRPYRDFSTTAYCSYSSFHPSQYMVDNNWDILCAFTTPGTTAKLDSMGIAYSDSRQRLILKSGI